jgi:hypothetical protein
LRIGEFYDYCLGVIVNLRDDHVEIVVIRLFLESQNYASYSDRHRFNANHPSVRWYVGRLNAGSEPIDRLYRISRVNVADSGIRQCLYCPSFRATVYAARLAGCG